VIQRAASSFSGDGPAIELDEMIKSMDKAQNEMIDIEHSSDAELQKLADKYQKVLRMRCPKSTERSDIW